MDIDCGKDDSIDEEGTDHGGSEDENIVGADAVAEDASYCEVPGAAAEVVVSRDTLLLDWRFIERRLPFWLMGFAREAPWRERKRYFDKVRLLVEPRSETREISHPKHSLMNKTISEPSMITRTPHVTLPDGLIILS